MTAEDPCRSIRSWVSIRVPSRASIALDGSNIAA
jgi:hypothetical protein